METNKQLNEKVVKFINNWIDEVNTNPEIVLGEWLYAFGAMSALALKSQELNREQLIGAIEYLYRSLKVVYENTDGAIKKASMQ